MKLNDEEIEELVSLYEERKKKKQLKYQMILKYRKRKILIMRNLRCVKKFIIYQYHDSLRLVLLFLFSL